MKSNLPNNSMRLMVAGSVALLFTSGFATPAFAESKLADQKKSDQAAIKVIGAETGTGFKQLDTNGDKNISLKEAVKDKTLVNVFDATDIDHDGMISTDEYDNYAATLSSMIKENVEKASVSN